jgi:hypothetical protein
MGYGKKELYEMKRDKKKWVEDKYDIEDNNG